MKRTFTILIPIALFLSLCACGAKQEAPAADQGRGQQESSQSQPSEHESKQTAPAASNSSESNLSENTPTTQDGIRPEFKELMDHYEAFFTDYVAFMKSLSENPGDLTMLARYAEYLTHYSETMAALDQISEGELTTAELSYYIEVMARIQQLLLTIAD